MIFRERLQYIALKIVLKNFTRPIKLSFQHFVYKIGDTKFGNRKQHNVTISKVMKQIFFSLLLTVMSVTALAQQRTISGSITDRDTKEPMEQTAVQLLRADSSYVAGTVSNADGAFQLTAPKDGKYIVKLSSVGYKTLFRNVNISGGHGAQLGKLQLAASAISLKGTTVTAQAAKVVLKKDTFVYNATAFRTPEGSTIEELVKRLPGAQVDDDGKITVNGKEVKKIKVDGKEFMVGDTKTAMKNLPTNIVNQIKAYDEKSDLAKVTGIDDGNEQTVLDFGLKKGMNRGFFGNADLSAGTKDRYAERLMAATFNSKLRVMGFGSFNNTGDMGFPGGGGRGSFGRGRSGLNASKMVGANFNYDNGSTFSWDGSVRWNHNDGDAITRSSSENFVSSSSSFANSLNRSLTRSDSWNAQMRFEWKPDTMTNIMFRPNMSVSYSDGNTSASSAQFNDDPYSYVDNPLSADAIKQMAKEGKVVNTSTSNSISYSNSKKFGGMLQINRKLGSKGRNVTLRGDFSYTDGTSKSLSTNNVHLYQILDRLGNDSTYQTNRFNLTPTKNYSYSVQTTYSEPLWRATFLQLSYKFSYSYSKSDRSTYDFSNLGEDFFSGLTPRYRRWDDWLARLDRPYTDYEDLSLSRYSEYRNYTHDIDLMVRMLREKYQLNFGVKMQPQASKFIQDYQGIHTDTVRNVVNFTPTLDFRYRFSKVSRLRINYRGTTSQPSMTDLLDITDDSDPLNISKGNPGLKPSFTNNFRAEYNNYIEKRQMAIMASLNYSNTRNSIGYKVTYDEQTGGRTTRPENINGNWNAGGMLIFNMAIDTTGYWNVNTFTNLDYQNRVGYLAIGRNTDSQRNITKSTTIGERLGLSYRNSWLEVELDGSMNYMHTRNNLQASSNLDTWQFAYGGTINLTAPWGTSLSTDLHQNSRRGYSDNSMNTNELIWNAQVAQSFLRGRALTVSLQFYDILANQSNFSRTVSAMSRSDVEYNSINSYAMLHVVYRLNIFGGKMARRGNGGPGDGPGRGGRQGFGGGRPPMGPPPMGGGHRPPMM